jgi:hypothetical protein
MRGTVAKRFRRLVFGDYSFRDTSKEGQLRKKRYRKLKREYKNKR